MKKIFLMATAALLFTGVAFADGGKKCKKSCKNKSGSCCKKGSKDSKKKCCSKDKEATVKM